MLSSSGSSSPRPPDPEERSITIHRNVGKSDITHPTTYRHKSQELNLQQHRCDSLKYGNSHIIFTDDRISEWRAHYFSSAVSIYLIFRESSILTVHAADIHDGMSRHRKLKRWTNGWTSTLKIHIISLKTTLCRYYEQNIRVISQYCGPKSRRNDDTEMAYVHGSDFQGLLS
jgi:hypothetical protein